MNYRCPNDKRHAEDIAGCGHTFNSQPDEEGFVDCPNCGMFFIAETNEAAEEMQC